MQSVVRAIALLKVPVHYNLTDNPAQQQNRIYQLLRGMRYVYSGDVMVSLFFFDFLAIIMLIFCIGCL